MDTENFNLDHLMETGEYLCPVCEDVMDILPNGDLKCSRCYNYIHAGNYTGLMDDDDELFEEELEEEDEENAWTYQEYLEIVEGKILDEDSSDIPEGCQACGGPYPNCVDSCPLFDD